MPQIFVHTDADQLEDFARSLAQKLGIHASNQFTLHPEKSIFTIDKAREMQDIALHAQDLSLIVVYDFDTARAESQNALLKTLEDMTDRVVYVLGVRDVSLILDTILSRCQVSYASSHDKLTHDRVEKYGLNPDVATLSSYLSVSSAIPKDDASQLVDELISLYRLRYSEHAYDGYVASMRGLLDVRRQLIYAHVSVECALDMVGYLLADAGVIRTA